LAIHQAQLSEFLEREPFGFSLQSGLEPYQSKFPARQS